MRNANGFGSVYKLSGKRRKPWAARKTVGWTFDEDRGKSYPIYSFIGYYETRAQALTALVEYNKDPYDLHHDTITFAEVYDKWSDIHFENVSKSNINGYKAAYALCDDIKDMPIRQIKLDHLQKIVDTSGKNTPTLKKLKGLFGLVYDYAVIHEIVQQDKRDMVRYVDISKAGNPNSIKRSPFTKREITTLWSLYKSNYYLSVVLMLIYTGVRISELLELKKNDIHMDERWFYVGKSKTDAGIREVPIADKIYPLFEYWMAKDCDNLICTPDEEPFTYQNYYDSYWIPLMIQLGFGKFIVVEGKKDPVYEGHRPHDARHTCVSLLTAAGVDERIVRSIVGHKGQGVTETVYTHIELPLKLEAINKI